MTVARGESLSTWNRCLHRLHPPQPSPPARSSIPHHPTSPSPLLSAAYHGNSALQTVVPASAVATAQRRRQHGSLPVLSRRTRAAFADAARTERPRRARQRRRVDRALRTRVPRQAHAAARRRGQRRRRTVPARPTRAARRRPRRAERSRLTRCRDGADRPRHARVPRLTRAAARRHRQPRRRAVRASVTRPCTAHVTQPAAVAEPARWTEGTRTRAHTAVLPRRTQHCGGVDRP